MHSSARSVMKRLVTGHEAWRVEQQTEHPSEKVSLDSMPGDTRRPSWPVSFWRIPRRRDKHGNGCQAVNRYGWLKCWQAIVRSPTQAGLAVVRYWKPREIYERRTAGV